ncbi:MAG: hypothetical protein HN742_38970 [Lentisphaerae bacterium]|jgi:trimethylamine:corrinoid methyltransferase-like protein|nr:hypothetical protein [Lentisphaerota bacterium]MBT5608558.1 hypothetical protein [Lentisphaerota bacterium]MBT7062099.1 hypothetical protein [Lentisphaerota bacterium]MBT7847914.1 hypothetical protein [Lentisphaerota bacterium]
MVRVLTDSDVEILVDGVCEVLEKQGFCCENHDILHAFQQAGAQVDLDQQVARFPDPLIREFAESVRAEDKSTWCDQLSPDNREIIYSGYHPYAPNEEFRAPRLPYMFHNLSTYYYDDDTRTRRLGNHDDFINLVKLGDVLHPDDGVGHILNLAGDTPAPIEPLEAALVLLEHANKPRGVYVHDIRQIEYLEEIEEIFEITDPHWHWMANICPSSPLKLDRLAAERYVHMLKTGIHPAKLAAMPVAGVNMPVTSAGSIVIIAAEFMVLWFAARLLQSKKIPLTGMPILGTMDLATADVSFTAFDAAIRRFAICDFIRSWAGVQLAPGPGEWTPTKEPGMYCTLEKAYFAMMAAAFTGVHPEVGVGHIDAGLSISPVQFLLDTEFTDSLKQLEKPSITREDLGLDAILDVGFGLREDHMTTDHTINHMRSAVWMPECWRRTSWSPETEADLLKQTRRKVKELQSQYEKPTGRDDQLAAARRVIDRAKCELIQN